MAEDKVALVASIIASKDKGYDVAVDEPVSGWVLAAAQEVVELLAPSSKKAQKAAPPAPAKATAKKAAKAAKKAKG